MSAAPNTLPTDPSVLQKMLAERDAVITRQANRIATLEESLRLQKLKKFGASSEKSPDQQEMFNEAELSAVVEEYLAESEAEQAQAAPKAPKAKSGRKPLPADLPRVRIEHELPESDKQCPCGCARTEIGEVCSEQLDIIPAQVRVLINVRKKYACPACEDGVQTAPLPPQPIPKSNASPGMLAHVVTSKYQDALPLHRQEAVLNRSGIEIPRNTLASWMIKAGELIQPLLNLMEDRMLAYPVLHCDETSVQVLKEPDKAPTSKSYMWVRVGGPPTQPVRLFHYADSRRSDVASALLAGYEGYLQTDDYAGYNAVGTEESITQLGCWAHARRKFVDAQKATAGKNKKAGKADMAISLIKKLYLIEKSIKESSVEARYNIRQEKSVPQLEKIRIWLDKSLHKTLPKGLLGKALAYLDKNWSKLTVYTEDGRLNIDNNPAENAIRPLRSGSQELALQCHGTGSQVQREPLQPD